MNRSREHARQLFRKAREEANLLPRWVEDSEIPSWFLGFHAQQSVEKSLKAVLANRGVEYPLTHNLGLLLDLVRQQGVEDPPDADRLKILNAFGTTFRYEEETESGPPPVLDRAWAAECAASTVRWAESALDTAKA